MQRHRTEPSMYQEIGPYQHHIYWIFYLTLFLLQNPEKCMLFSLFCFQDTPVFVAKNYLFPLSFRCFWFLVSSTISNKQMCMWSMSCVCARCIHEWESMHVRAEKNVGCPLCFLSLGLGLPLILGRGVLAWLSGL